MPDEKQLMYSGILACYANCRILGFLPQAFAAREDTAVQCAVQTSGLSLQGARASATAMRFCAGLFGKDAALELLPQEYEHI